MCSWVESRKNIYVNLDELVVIWFLIWFNVVKLVIEGFRAITRQLYFSKLRKTQKPVLKILGE